MVKSSAKIKFFIQFFVLAGTFVAYDTVNGITDLELNGVAAGTFYDGTTVYIGHSDNSECFNQLNCPSRISTNSSGPGGEFEVKVEKFEVRVEIFEVRVEKFEVRVEGF